MSDTESTNPAEKPVNDGGGGTTTPSDPAGPNTCPGPHGTGGGDD